MSTPPVGLVARPSPWARIVRANDRCLDTEAAIGADLSVLGVVAHLVVNLTLRDLTRADFC